MPTRSNPVVHLELHTADLRRARALYAELCGWRPERIHTGHGSYVALDLGGRELGGGVVECETRKAIWLPYVDVTERDRDARGRRARFRAAEAMSFATAPGP